MLEAEKIYHDNTNQKRTGIAIISLEKVDIRPKRFLR